MSNHRDARHPECPPVLLLYVPETTSAIGPSVIGKVLEIEVKDNSQDVRWLQQYVKRKGPRKSCNLCGHTRSTHGGVMLHVLAVHFRFYPYQCAYCPKVALDIMKLKGHVEKDHQGKPYKMIRRGKLSYDEAQQHRYRNQEVFHMLDPLPDIEKDSMPAAARGPTPPPTPLSPVPPQDTAPVVQHSPRQPEASPRQRDPSPVPATMAKSPPSAKPKKTPYKCRYCEFSTKWSIRDIQKHIYHTHLKRKIATCNVCEYGVNGPHAEAKIEQHFKRCHTGKSDWTSHLNEMMSKIVPVEQRDGSFVVGAIGDKGEVLSLSEEVKEKQGAKRKATTSPSPARKKTRRHVEVPSSSASEQEPASSFALSTTVVPPDVKWKIGNVAAERVKIHVARNKVVFGCSECFELFDRRDKVVDHLKRKYNIRPYVCTVCNMEFLVKHIAGTHMKEKHDSDDVLTLDDLIQNLRDKTMILNPASLPDTIHTLKGEEFTLRKAATAGAPSRAVTLSVTSSTVSTGKAQCAKKSTSKPAKFTSLRPNIPTGRMQKKKKIPFAIFHSKSKHGDLYKTDTTNIPEAKIAKWPAYVKRGGQFHCNVCTDVSSDKPKAMRHVIRHTTYRPFSCDVCGYRCFNHDVIARHVTSKHKMETASKGYRKNEHPPTFYLNKLTLDLLEKMLLEEDDSVAKDDQPKAAKVVVPSETEVSIVPIPKLTRICPKQYKCHYCNFSRPKLNLVIQHQQFHFTWRPFACNFCSTESHNKMRLVEHQKKCRPGQRQPPPKRNPRPSVYHLTQATCEKMGSNHSQGAAVQQYSGLSSIGKETLSGSIQNKETVTRQPSDRLTRQQGNLHVESRTVFTATMKSKPPVIKVGDEYKCNFCNFISNVASNCINHQNNHFTYRPYKCESCSLQCLKPTYLRKHSKMMHGKTIDPKRLPKPDLYKLNKATCMSLGIKRKNAAKPTEASSKEIMKKLDDGITQETQLEEKKNLRSNKLDKDRTIREIPGTLPVDDNGRIFNATMKFKPTVLKVGAHRHKCNFCEFGSHEQTTCIAHQNRHFTFKPYKCESCSYQTLTRASVRKHSEMIHGKMVNPKRLPNPKVYTLNEATCEKLGIDGKNAAEQIEASSDDMMGNLDDGKTQETPLEENQNLRSTKFYKDRTVREIPGTLPVDDSGRIFNATMKFKPTVVKVGADKYKCNFCDFVSHMRTSCWAHQNQHFTFRPYKCETCGYQALTGVIVRKHTRRVHGKRVNPKRLPNPMVYTLNEATCENLGIDGKNAAERIEASDDMMRNLDDGKTQETPLEENQILESKTKFDKERMVREIPVPLSMDEESRFKCNYCAFTRSMQTAVKLHQRTHFTWKPFRCTICGFAAFRDTVMKDHLTSAHKDKPAAIETMPLPDVFHLNEKTCISLGIVQEKTASKEVEELKLCKPTDALYASLPQAVNFREKYVCPLCENEFDTKNQADEHIVMEHFIWRPYKCRYCKFAVFNKSDVFQHCKKMHPTKARKVFSNNKPYKQMLNEKTCKAFGLNLPEQPGMLLKNTAEGDEDMKFALSSIPCPSKVHSKTYMCRFCNFKSTSIIATKHQKLHFTYRPFTCDLCPCVCFVRQDMEKHAAWHGNERDTFTTHLLPDHYFFTFKTREELGERIHQFLGKEKRTCKRCEEDFETDAKLLKHMENEHKECVQFECQVCLKRVFTKRDFDAHHIELHGHCLPDYKVVSLPDLDKGIQPCAVCNVAIPNSFPMDIHLADLHADRVNIICAHCKQDFSDRGQLYLHHADVHPNKILEFTTILKRAEIQCPVCHEHQKSEWSLDLHLCKIHPEHVQLMCNLCAEVIQSEDKMRKHLDVVHKLSTGAQYSVIRNIQKDLLEPEKKKPRLEKSADLVETTTEDFTSINSEMNTAEGEVGMVETTKVFGNGQFSHIIVKNATDFKCKVCGFSAPDYRSIYNHTYTKHLDLKKKAEYHNSIAKLMGREKKKFLCKVCKCTKDNKHKMYMHIRQCHKEQVLSARETLVKEVKEKSEVSEKNSEQIPEESCGKSIPKTSIQQSGNKQKDQGPIAKFISRKDETFECQVCNLASFSRRKVYTHIWHNHKSEWKTGFNTKSDATETKVKKKVARICTQTKLGSTILQKNKVKRNIGDMILVKGKGFECSDCKFASKSRNKVYMHIWHYHGGQRSWKGGKRGRKAAPEMQNKPAVSEKVVEPELTEKEAKLDNHTVQDISSKGSKSQYRHIILESATGYKCKVCEYSTGMFQRIYNHVTAKHKDMKLKNPDSDHVRAGQFTVDSSRLELEAHIIYSTNGKCFECGICQRRSLNRRDIYQHICDDHKHLKQIE